MAARHRRPAEQDTGQGDTTGRPAAAGRETREERDARFERDAVAHLNRLYAAGLRMTGNRTEAEDLVQETYVRAYRVFDRISCDADLAAFLFRMQNNVWENSYRHDDSAREVALLDAPDGHYWRSSEIAAFKQLSDAALVDAFAALPAELRVALYFADVEGYSYQEIAEITEVPRSIVMTRLFQGRRRLRGLLMEHAMRRTLRRGVPDDGRVVA
ncbi:sigma-70 family RNA polymerase sigma factor [Yinghuangia soli]|uniref:Sigma-70 family RNA polymerase sigma factor n=1 Tax=Yinghuangia soli TaxID=2908204 RepID=A0AA41PY87_9ACTN|nr:sigma-70 family RNA polymerase sigma factor [Yinghuangia soli]MCF2527958.1 sigma-70 family RNA polymerase sigma factor [Yinghuangia soli]